MSRYMNHLVHTLCLCTFLIDPCLSFASWLVERGPSCWVDLRDPSEVIMNAMIVPAEKSSNTNVSMRILDTNTRKEVSLENVNGKNVIYLPTEKIRLQYTLQLIVPPDLKDLQYVMDMQMHPEADEDEIEMEDKKESDTMLNADFTSSRRGCKNKRAYGRRGDEGLDFQIEVAPIDPIISLDGVEEQWVEVVTGWACGHEAVTLTQPIYFKFRQKNEQSGEDLVKGETEEEFVARKQESFRKITESRENNIEAEQLKSKAKKRMPPVSTVRKFRAFYEDNSAMLSFSFASYLQGSAFMIVFSLVLIKLSLTLSSRHDKGKREL
mmetsp:Transcript_6247/g.9068  ORF Transcript_6247/g.9068 Transcript_6247/m.9068 type:complete len:323 (-) Transcript_6247:78-1046(-)|eukprot:CAMPEP_0184865656 /NCGR_PEP_ID=MMETSP0580-20130426/18780_1 /TAXON_ID=1118495 /ORGANISM="Dactyliosolen fragilissimus" /LENGTH=322 /DNA_ID=CAMNT_0027364943 /DNA_START=8 /DNA_END=976 /DNA_ORIENTATION=-